jgi:sRNA-binding carbon storage regulator CsrA
MLILTRLPGQRLRIEPRPDLDPATPVAELFRGGPIEILVARVEGGRVQLGVEAHPGLLVLRDELGDG